MVGTDGSTRKRWGDGRDRHEAVEEADGTHVRQAAGGWAGQT